jgi:hypothetical protein
MQNFSLRGWSESRLRFRDVLTVNPRNRGAGDTTPEQWASGQGSENSHDVFGVSQTVTLASFPRASAKRGFSSR